MILETNCHYLLSEFKKEENEERMDCFETQLRAAAL